MTKTKQTIYVVRGLGLGDDEDTFENMCAYASIAEAEAFIEEVMREDEEEMGQAGEYDIEELKLIA